MIGKLIDYNGREITLENIWNLKQLILTMDEFTKTKLSIHDRFAEDYVYKVYVRDGANITRTVDGEKQVIDGKVIMGYYDSIYDAIDYVEKTVGMIGDVEYVEHTYDDNNECTVYTIKTENYFTLDIVEQERGILIWR